MAISRSDLAVPLLTQSPPGQISNVHEALLGLIGSDGDRPQEDVDEFKDKANAAREEHNVEQLIVVGLPDPEKGQSILCRTAIHVARSDRYLSPRHQISYTVDHNTLKTSDAKPYKNNQHVEELRSQIEQFLTAYVKDRYATGVVEVFATSLPRKTIEVADSVMEDAKASEAEATSGASEVADSTTEETADGEDLNDGKEKEEVEMNDDPVEAVATAEAVEENREKKDGDETVAAASTTTEIQEEVDEETQGPTKLVVHLVANKYKLSNFWSGRWRSSYVLDSAESSELQATANVQVHYFEEGNVQLHTSKSDTLAVQASKSVDQTAKSIVKSIESFEESYQQELFKQCSDLSEGAFRALRRQLPMTRQKIDWDKVLNYKLGSELSKQ